MSESTTDLQAFLPLRVKRLEAEVAELERLLAERKGQLVEARLFAENLRFTTLPTTERPETEAELVARDNGVTARRRRKG